MEFKLPDLHKHWPFPRITSPWNEYVATASADWLGAFPLLPPSAMKKLCQMDVGLFASLTYPHHSKEFLRLACDHIYILFAVDEITDVLNPEEVRGVAKIVLDALRNPDKPRPEGEHCVGELHRQFWFKALSVSSDTAARRFIKHYEEYMSAVITEAEDRNSTTIRKNIDDYLSLRRFTGAVRPAFDLILLPLEIPDEILLDQRIVDLELMSIDLISVANDVISFNVEQTRGDIHNAVIVVRNQYNCSIQEAMRYIEGWYHKRANDFLNAMVDLPECHDIKVRDQLKQYIFGLGNWVTANYEWSFCDERYFGADLDKVKQTGIVSLLPPRKQIVVNA